MRSIEKALPVFALTTVFAVLLVYSLAVTETYAWADDYPRLASPSSSFFEDASGGRVLAAPLMVASFAAAHSIPRLRYLRALGLAGIALLAASLAHLIRREGVPTRYALFLAVTSALLPTFQMYAGWATAWTFSWTCLLSLWAGRAWLDGRTRPVRTAGFLGLMAASLLYQPGAFFAWTMIGLRLSLHMDRVDEAVRRTGRLLVGTVLGAAAALIVGQAVNVVFHVEWKARAAVVATLPDLARKISWAVTRPLVIGARPFAVASPSVRLALVTAGPVLLLLACDWLCRATGTFKKRLLTLGLLATVPLLAMLPSLVVRENQIDFRILPGLCVVMWMYASTSAYFVGRTVARLTRFDVGRMALLADGACLAFVVALAILCRQHIAETMILPNQAKDAYIRSALRGLGSVEPTAIVIVNDPAWWRHRPRIGTFSIQSDLMLDWVSVPDVRLVARESGLAMSQVLVSVMPRRPAGKSQALIIDLSPLEPVLNRW